MGRNYYTPGDTTCRKTSFLVLIEKEDHIKEETNSQKIIEENSKQKNKINPNLLDSMQIL